jgi:hypothetical protein
MINTNFLIKFFLREGRDFKGVPESFSGTVDIVTVDIENDIFKPSSNCFCFNSFEHRLSINTIWGIYNKVDWNFNYCPHFTSFRMLPISTQKVSSARLNFFLVLEPLKFLTRGNCCKLFFHN